MQQGGWHQHAGGQDGRKVQQDADKQNTKGGGTSDWSVHMTGLIGWWRRVENIQNKQDEKQRRILEKQQKMSVAKLNFVRRYFPMMTTPKQGTASPNPAIGTSARNLKNSVMLSPATKRKGREVDHSEEF